jgi:ribosomal-protein-alanine N-acetyltransferase
MSTVSIRPVAGPGDIEACARMMECSEPWTTLGRGYEAGLRMLQDATRERYLAMVDHAVAGFVVLVMQGTLVGYLQTICVAPDRRGSGIGRALMEHAEAMVFARHPNLFLTVSDFNEPAQRFYERLGYERVGALRDYLVAGRSEILMRKSRGPIRGWSPA